MPFRGDRVEHDARDLDERQQGGEMEQQQPPERGPQVQRGAGPCPRQQSSAIQEQRDDGDGDGQAEILRGHRDKPQPRRRGVIEGLRVEADGEVDNLDDQKGDQAELAHDKRRAKATAVPVPVR